jgi:beta-lactamase regulating signal transducer with metallopeptidase domain
VTAPALPDLADQLALLLRATLLMGAAWAAATALRKLGAPAAARHIAWLVGIAALLALPLIWWLVPGFRLPILPTGAATAAAGVPPIASAPGPFVSTGSILAEASGASAWSILLALVYALGAAPLLLRFLIGRRMLARLWSDAGPVADPALEKLLSRLSRDIGLSRQVELRFARGPAVPMTWGTLAPKVLLPAEAWEWPLERRRLVLLHELAHVARRDSLSRSMASLACALYWFHPGAWLAARRMRMEQEHAADDRVLMAGGSPEAYAFSLLHLARGSGGKPQFAQAAAMAGMYQLERRLLAITGASRRDRPGAVFLSSSAFLGGLTTVFVAAGVPVSATPALPGSFRADRIDTAPLAEKAESVRLEESSETPRPAEGLSSESADPMASLAEPESRPAEIESRAPVRLAATAPSGLDPSEADGQESRDREPRSADSQQLRNYGWELPRSGFKARTDALAESSAQPRLTLPEPPSASKDRIGLPKWARNAPQLVRGRPPTGSHPSAQGPLVLSWSLEVVGK